MDERSRTGRSDAEVDNFDDKNTSGSVTAMSHAGYSSRQRLPKPQFFDHTRTHGTEGPPARNTNHPFLTLPTGLDDFSEALIGCVY